MHIYSKGNSFIASFPTTGVWHEWRKGSHTVNVYSKSSNLDCYTFGWSKDNPTMLDFTAALASYLED